MTVTANGTDRADSTVSRNRGCTRCDEVRQSGHHGLDWYRHCLTCCAAAKPADRHYACDECGKCLPRRARKDRYFCSSSCRVKRFQWWRSSEGIAERQRIDVWQRSPEAQQVAELLRVVGDMGDRADGVQRRKLREIESRARATAESCARCGADVAPTQPVWRRPRTYGASFGLGLGAGQAVQPVCYACRCETWRKEGEATDRHTKLHCERCEPRGAWHKVRWLCPDAYDPEHKDRMTFCDGCHPKAWREAKPCGACNRTVIDSIYLKGSYRHVRWIPDGNYLYRDTWIGEAQTACSERCRRQLRASARSEAKPDRQPIDCTVCGERIDVRRSDAAYCSPACRQKAYRQRKVETPEKLLEASA